MAQSSLVLPVLGNNPKDRLSYIKGTIAEMRGEVKTLRERKTVGGAVPVESKTVDSLHFLLLRLSGEVSRLGLCL